MKSKKTILSFLLGVFVICLAGCSEKADNSKVDTSKVSEETWNTFTKLETYKVCNFEINSTLETKVNNEIYSIENEKKEVEISPLAIEISYFDLKDNDVIETKEKMGEDGIKLKKETLMSFFIVFNNFDLYEYNKEIKSYNIIEESKFNYIPYDKGYIFTIYDAKITFNNNIPTLIDAKIAVEESDSSLKVTAKIIYDFVVTFSEFITNSSSEKLDSDAWNKVSNMDNFNNVTMNFNIEQTLNGINEELLMKLEIDGSAYYMITNNSDGSFDESYSADGSGTIDYYKNLYISILSDLKSEYFIYNKNTNTYKIPGLIKCDTFFDYSDLEIKISNKKITTLSYVLSVSDNFVNVSITFTNYGTTTLTK